MVERLLRWHCQRHTHHHRTDGSGHHTGSPRDKKWPLQPALHHHGPVLRLSLVCGASLLPPGLSLTTSLPQGVPMGTRVL